MKKHVMAMTYEPKIEAVLSGECRQTIRKCNKFSIGDEILIHGWEGKPYRSKWSWRKRVKVIDVINISVSLGGISFIKYKHERPGYSRIEHLWDSEWCNILAQEDGVENGFKLGVVLFKLNGIPKQPEEYQIIRW